MQHLYIDSEPVSIPKEILRLYQYLSFRKTRNNDNTGLMIEDGCFEFMFVKERDVQLQIRNSKPIDLPHCFALGKLLMPYKFIFPKKLTFFSIKFQPWVSSFFFPDDFSIADLSKQYGSKITALHEKIFTSGSFKDMRNCAEEFIKSEKMPERKDYEVSRKICHHIYRNKGNIKIQELLSGFPHSRQMLNKMFLLQTKNSIKEFAVFVRIREVIKHKVKNPDKSLTDVALEFGYFDQSHFIKDMKKVTGLPPSRFLAKNNLFSEQLKL